MMNKFALIVCVYRRLDLEAITLQRFVKQGHKFGFDVIVAGSEGEYSQSISSGCTYFEIENFPVSNKHNELVSRIRGKYDGVFLFGSDDMVSDNYFEHILSKYNENTTELVGVRDIYFYSNESKKLHYWYGYQNGTKTAGAGRFFSRYVLDKLDWKPWKNGINKGLDSSTDAKLLKQQIEQIIIDAKENNIFLVDIKHTRSITSKDILGCCEVVNSNIMEKKVGRRTKRQVDELKQPETVAVERISGLHLVDFLPNGKFKPLGLDVLRVSANDAQAFIDKGFGKLA